MFISDATRADRAHVVSKMMRLRKAVERHTKISTPALSQAAPASRLFSLIDEAQRNSFTTQM
jgi:hypothetical protein